MAASTITLLKGPVEVTATERTIKQGIGGDGNGPFVQTTDITRKAIITLLGSGVPAGGAFPSLVLTAMVTSDDGDSWSLATSAISINPSATGGGNVQVTGVQYGNKVYCSGVPTIGTIGLYAFDLITFTWSTVNAAIGTYISGGLVVTPQIVAINSVGYGIIIAADFGGGQHVIPFDVTGVAYGEGNVTFGGTGISFGGSTVDSSDRITAATPSLGPFFAPNITRWATGVAYNGYTQATATLDNTTSDLASQFLSTFVFTAPNLRGYYINVVNSTYTSSPENVQIDPALVALNESAPMNPRSLWITALLGYAFLFYPVVDTANGKLVVNTRDLSIPASDVTGWGNAGGITFYQTLYDQNGSTSLLPFTATLVSNCRIEEATPIGLKVGLITCNPSYPGNPEPSTLTSSYWYWQILIGESDPPVLSCPVSANVILGSTYTGTMVVTGGTGPFTFTLDSGPTWLSINATTGVLIGTPIAVGVFSYTVTVTDSLSQTSTATCAIGVTTRPFGVRKPIVVTPNPFDLCLAREYKLFQDIDYTLLVCCKKPDCFNYDERTWGMPCV